MNILNLIQSQLSPQAIGQISSAVGESPDATKSALGTAVPALLGSLVGKVNASPDGASQIFNLIKQGPGAGGSWSDSISGLSGGSGGQSQSTSSLLSSLLGSKLGGVSNFIAGNSGVKASSAMSLIGMAAPLLMGTIGKHIASEGLGATGLGDLLNSQKEHLKDALPSGLANTLGIGPLLGGTSETAKVPTEAAGAPQPQYQQRPPSARPVITPAAPAPRSSPLKWAVPLLLALGIGAWAFMHRSNNMPAPVGGTADYTQTQTGHAVGAPDWSSLNLTPGSVADKLSKAISGGDSSKKIELDGVNFDAAGHLEDSANAQVKEIGSVLKMSPNSKVTITGYGTTEEEGMNEANSLKSALVSAGTSADHVMTRGEAGTGVPSIKLMQ